MRGVVCLQKGDTMSTQTNTINTTAGPITGRLLNTVNDVESSTNTLSGDPVNVSFRFESDGKLKFQLGDFTIGASGGITLPPDAAAKLTAIEIDVRDENGEQVLIVDENGDAVLDDDGEYQYATVRIPVTKPASGGFRQEISSASGKLILIPVRPAKSSDRTVGHLVHPIMGDARRVTISPQVHTNPDGEHKLYLWAGAHLKDGRRGGRVLSF